MIRHLRIFGIHAVSFFLLLAMLLLPQFGQPMAEFCQHFVANVFNVLMKMSVQYCHLHLIILSFRVSSIYLYHPAGTTSDTATLYNRAYNAPTHQGRELVK